MKKIALFTLILLLAFPVISLATSTSFSPFDRSINKIIESIEKISSEIEKASEITNNTHNLNMLNTYKEFDGKTVTNKSDLDAIRTVLKSRPGVTAVIRLANNGKEIDIIKNHSPLSNEFYNPVSYTISHEIITPRLYKKIVGEKTKLKLVLQQNSYKSKSITKFDTQNVYDGYTFNTQNETERQNLNTFLSSINSESLLPIKLKCLETEEKANSKDISNILSKFWENSSSDCKNGTFAVKYLPSQENWEQINIIQLKNDKYDFNYKLDGTWLMKSGKYTYELNLKSEKNGKVSGTLKQDDSNIKWKVSGEIKNGQVDLKSYFDSYESTLNFYTSRYTLKEKDDFDPYKHLAEQIFKNKDVAYIGFKFNFNGIYEIKASQEGYDHVLKGNTKNYDLEDVKRGNKGSVTLYKSPMTSN